MDIKENNKIDEKAKKSEVNEKNEINPSEIIKKDEVIEKKSDDIKDVKTIYDDVMNNREEAFLAKFDENLNNHIKDKEMILDEECKLKFLYIYSLIDQNKLIDDEHINSFYFKDYFLIYDLKTEFAYIFLFKLVNIKFLIKEKEKIDEKIIKICSTYEIIDYCKKNKYKPYFEIETIKYKLQDIKNFDIIQKIKKFENITFVQENYEYDEYKNEKELQDYPSDDTSLEPDKLSKFFLLFFKFNSKQMFKFWASDKRTKLLFKICDFKKQTDLYMFKICGPSGIGKSMTLFLLSRYYHNYLYFNIKTLRDLKLKEDIVNYSNILIESCKYLTLTKEQLDELTSKKNNYFNSLYSIVKFLINNKLLSVIILDQFKYDSIDKNEYDLILADISKQKSKYVKILICCSTNDKEIREECLKSWNEKIFFENKLNEKNQNYFFYIDELCEKNDDKDSYYGKILAEFNWIPKYKQIFSYLDKNPKEDEKKKDR